MNLRTVGFLMSFNCCMDVLQQGDSSPNCFFDFERGSLIKNSLTLPNKAYIFSIA
jgi:hypothetical protein